MRMVPGYSFNISEHPRSAINRDYTMLSVIHSGHDPQVHEDENSGLPTTYQNQFICIPRDVIFKAPKQPAPMVDGPQTAVVVGPAGEEIYTDKLGRIKVQVSIGTATVTMMSMLAAGFVLANQWQHQLGVPFICHVLDTKLWLPF